MEKLDGKSMDLEKQSIEKIKELFPEVVTEGKIDFDKLRLILGDEVDESIEKYQFTWNGKSQTIKLAQKPSTGTLRPAKDESKNWDTTKNLYIEGDNLEVLKQLQKTYFGKIKMIYIDPPYNTGGDFVYKDDFKDSIQNYKSQTNQVSKMNPDTNGRYHTDWINLMYSRLILSKNLLSNDGIIFVSIDDIELFNLKKILDEIFGETNFVANFIRKNKSGSGHDSKSVAIEYDYILMYGKNTSENGINKQVVDVKKDNKYKFEDKYVDRRGKYYLRDLDYRGNYSKNLDYPIKSPDGKAIYPGGTEGAPNTWRWSKGKFQWGIEKEFIEFKRCLNGWKIYIKQYQFVDNNDETYQRKVPYRAMITFLNGEGSIETDALLGNRVFTYPKSSSMIKHLLNVGSKKDSIILDFFSGSATTAHAVMKLNSEDGGNRKFIMVQLPEKTDTKSEAYKAGYDNICEIGKERIRRAGEQIKKGLEKEGKDSSKLDIGFKVFKLDDTNIKEWDSSQEVSENTLFDQQEVFKEGRTTEDVLYEILLKYGVFDMPVSETLVNDKVAYDIGQGDMIVALFDKISSDDVKAIADKKPRVVIFKDSGFKDDNVKLNALHNLEKQGIEDVKSI